MQECLKDLKEIFSKPGEFSVQLKEGESYITEISPTEFIVSKRWGYWIVVIDTLNRYFNENGLLDEGEGGILPSNTDIMGTVIKSITEEEIKERCKK